MSDEFEVTSHHSLLREVGPRASKSNLASSSSSTIATPASASQAMSARQRNLHKKKRTALLQPLQASGSPPPSMLATAAATPSLPIPSVLSSRALLHSEASEDSSKDQGLSYVSMAQQAHFVAQIWRETRNFTRKQQEAQLTARAALRQKKNQPIGGIGEEKHAGEEKSALKHPHRNSLSVHSTVQLPSIPLMPDTLSSIDSLLNPQSIVHVAAALSVEQLQREELSRQVASPHHSSHKAMATANAMSSHSNLPHAPTTSMSVTSLPSPRIRQSQRSFHQASQNRFNPQSPYYVAPSPMNEMHLSSATNYLHHIVGVYNAWQQQLAFMSQDLYTAKCADLGLTPAYERRDKFISRILDQGAKDGILRLVAQGLGVQSARAIVGFLRRVQAFAAPTDEERGIRRTHARKSSADMDLAPSQPESGINTDSDVSDDEPHVVENIDHEEFLKRSFESSNKSPLTSPSMGAANSTTSEAGMKAFTFDLAADSNEPHSMLTNASEKSLAEGESVSQFISGLHGLNTNTELRGTGSLPNIPNGFQLAPVDENANATSSTTSLMPPTHSHHLLSFQRRHFHALDLTSNNLGDDGALELSVLFLPNPRQLEKDAEAAALASSNKAERKRAREERKRNKLRAKQLGLDLRAGEDETDSLYPLSGLKTLVLRSNSLTPQGFAILFDSMAHGHAPLTSLDLSANSAVNTNAVLLGHGVSGSTPSGIGLGGNMFIGLEGCHSLGSLLLKNVNLTSLSLHNVGIGTVPNGIEFIAAGIRENKSLITLDLSANRLSGNSELQTLMNAIKLSKITDLNLSHNPIHSIGAAHVGTYVAGSESLTRLRLDSCAIGVAGLALLSRSMEIAPSLSDCYLDGNEFQAGKGSMERELHHITLARMLVQQGINEMCVSPAIAQNLSLHSMHFNYANMDDRTIADLCSCLAGHNTLHTLTFRSNRIGDAGGVAIAQLLRSNKIINYIDLYMNFIGDVGGIAIAKACADGSVCNHISLQNNKLSNKSAEVFVYALSCDPELAYLLVDGNQIDYYWYQQLTSACTRNRRQFERTVLPSQYRIIRSLLRDKAKCVEVSLLRDQAALQDRRNTDYLNNLQSGMKLHNQTELNITDELQAELNRLKLENLDIQSHIRAAQASLATESNKREGKLHEWSSALNSERNQTILLKKKLKKGRNDSLNVATIGSVLPDSSRRSTGGQSRVPDAERNNAEAILRVETKKLDALKQDGAQLKKDIEAFFETLMNKLAKKKPVKPEGKTNRLDPAMVATSPTSSKPNSRRGSISAKDPK